MKIKDFAAGLADICSRSPLAVARPLVWTIIANPSAGGFTIRSRWKKHYSALSAYAEQARSRSPRQGGSGPSDTAREADAGSGTLGSLGLIPTRGPGHAGEITRSLIDEAEASHGSSGGAQPFYLIITAGGDGTSLEVQLELFNLPPSLKSSFAVLRLPMGTGNDGADSWGLGGALELLIHPVRVEFAQALRLTTASGKGPFLAFNILSVGLDAFVTHMTNKMKGKLPGDSYRLWVDIASLLYDRLYKVGTMEVKAFDEKGLLVNAFSEAVLLLAVGASGRRTYGSHKRILPDERNVCAVKQMPLLRKVALKGLFSTGEHIHKPESILFNARRVEFNYGYPILAQMDGETVLLQKDDYPAAIELTEAVIPVLKKI
ncbi:diacylglycerol kinase [Treponema sp. OttesenSCG-928-L16]|nr:diacylglycerol kinase [Treponema sp. OttesenSCG-928-L16]